MTKIIATIGPSSESPEILGYFAKNNVEFARLNTSHNSLAWHQKIGSMARQNGLKLLLDIPGPKVRLGELTNDISFKKDELFVLEVFDQSREYPYSINYHNEQVFVLPVRYNFFKDAKKNHKILFDDGKMIANVIETNSDTIILKNQHFGCLKSNKSLNFPETDVKIDFLTEKDKNILDHLVPTLKPEVIAISFLKNFAEFEQFIDFLGLIKKENKLTGYKPKICVKVEQQEIFESSNIQKIAEKSDMLMVARGDLALETQPLHLAAPFLQEYIKKVANHYKKDLIVATQMFESMIDTNVPNRSEISDLYRAVIIDKADYVMLSGESATGKYPKQVVDIMSDMAKNNKKYQKNFEPAPNKKLLGIF